jgi:hypothetical protein
VLAKTGSNCLHRYVEHISDAPFSSYDAGHACIGFQFASQAQHLNIDTTVEHVFMHARGLQKIFAAKRPLCCIEKRD